MFHIFLGGRWRGSPQTYYVFGVGQNHHSVALLELFGWLSNNFFEAWSKLKVVYPWTTNYKIVRLVGPKGSVPCSKRYLSESITSDKSYVPVCCSCWFAAAWCAEQSRIYGDNVCVCVISLWPMFPDGIMLTEKDLDAFSGKLLSSWIGVWDWISLPQMKVPKATDVLLWPNFMCCSSVASGLLCFCLTAWCDIAASVPEHCYDIAVVVCHGFITLQGLLRDAVSPHLWNGRYVPGMPSAVFCSCLSLCCLLPATSAWA